MNGPTRLERGRAAEAIAAAYLFLRGFRILGRNVRDGPRELDLIAQAGRLIVFAEVKFRSSRRCGGARLALKASQKLDLERAAVAWLKSTGRVGQPVRFDFVGVEFESDEGLRVSHVAGAYAASGRFNL